MKTATLLSSGIFCFLLLSCSTVPQPQHTQTNSSGTLTELSNLLEQRASHTATLLPNGKVLIAGGFKKGPDGYSQLYFRSAELYDPATKKFSFTGAMRTARCGHTATLLSNGKVLLTGGWNETDRVTSAELYDPATGTFQSAGTMQMARGGHTATLLKTGEVLIAGGTEHATDAELFNPRDNSFRTAGKMTAHRSGHTATLLSNGKVLLVGGSSGKEDSVLASAELYDPNAGSFVATGTMAEVRYKHAAQILPDGTVLIIGGSDKRDWRGRSKTAEIYHPQSGQFTRANDMSVERFKMPNSIIMTGETVLITGGNKLMETYTPSNGTFSVSDSLDEPHYYSSATVLRDGSVLIAGGYNNLPQASGKAWIYRPEN